MSLSTGINEGRSAALIALVCVAAWISPGGAADAAGAPIPIKQPLLAKSLYGAFIDYASRSR